MAASDTPGGWKITGQQEDTAQGPSGQYERGWRVTFQTVPGGTIGSVFVPGSKYTPDGVRELVAAKAADVSAIERMTS